MIKIVIVIHKMKVMKMMKMMVVVSPAVCSSSISPAGPFLCLDIIYLSVLLEELGFPPNKTFKVSRPAAPAGSAPASNPALSVFSWPGPFRGWRPAGLWAPLSTTSPRPEVTFDLPQLSPECFSQTQSGASDEDGHQPISREEFILAAAVGKGLIGSAHMTAHCLSNTHVIKSLN